MPAGHNAGGLFGYLALSESLVHLIKIQIMQLELELEVQGGRAHAAAAAAAERSTTVLCPVVYASGRGVLQL